MASKELSQLLEVDKKNMTARNYLFLATLDIKWGIKPWASMERITEIARF